MKPAFKYIGLVALVLLPGCTLWHGPAADLPSKNGIVAGESITVGGNENIYGIAREHNVSMRELIVLNDLKPPFEVKQGQTLILPATGQSFGGNMPVPSPAPLDTVEKSALPPIEPAGVSSEALEPVPPAPMQPQPLPPAAPSGASSVQQIPLSHPAPQAAPAPQSALQTHEPVQALNQPSPPQKQMATTLQDSSRAADEAAASLSMKWPLQGPILSGFGPKGPGLNNDGINIGAPKGAPVTAAAPGTVVYAGDEMKGFGNLVLIRHTDDWVTAYAHLDRVLVKKDAVVAQGDMIGTVGKTGSVATPQLHFETRHNGKPVDPAQVVKTAL
ncbi:MAG: LysM peptidoglycan-binding domain-containing M23 family metallopeptidase [Alphaproteobacteria bacterium]|nr:LysM peptidoglycan-binding domain-containing M23 family metallopeptidase [Alphaproteobacteria bacterium]